MSNLTRALKSIINGDNNFCSLCFNIYDARDLICSKDKASIVRNNKNESIVMSDLILTILGSDFTQYLETLDNVCESCAKSLISCYTFIQTCNSNASLLTNALDGLETTAQNISRPKEEKSLFVSIKLNNFSSQFIYDNQHIFTPEMALKRYLVLNASTIQEPKIKGNMNKYGINYSDMLLDPNNQHIFQCKVCLKIYRSMLKLRNHYIKIHIEKKHKIPKIIRSKTRDTDNYHRLTCKECGKSYNNLNAYKMHRINHVMTLVCPDCGRTYKNQATFKNHLQLNICNQERRHNPAEAKYTCDYCNKKYTQKMSLRVHIQFEHDGNYKAHICEWCGKKFWAQSRLKAHIVKHTRERNFSCSICQRKFVTKESLLYHTRLHTGEKPYKCPQCSSQFLSASRRSDHVKRYHNGAKPGFQCDVCHGIFRSSDFLFKHKKTHDGKMTKTMTTPKLHTIRVDRYKEKPQRDFIESSTNKNNYSADNIFVENLINNMK